MTHHNAKLRSAMTAIAAVLALSSTPLFAQDTAVPDPVLESTTEPVATPDPLAPEPAAPEEPVVTESANETAKASEPAAKPKAATRRTSATARPSATRSSAAAAPPAIAAPPAEELIDAPVAAPAMTAPLPPPVTIPAETAAVDQAQQMDNMLALGGAAGLGLLAAGIALRRRRRRKEEERVEEAKWAFIEASPGTQVEREPAFARAPAPIHDPVPPARTPAQANGPVTKLPSGFDLSRFGPHVQAAYRGPTPDNPSLSLKYRLRRASFLDQKERAANEAAARAAKVPAKGNWESRSDSDFLFRRAPANNGAKPAFQR